MAKYFQIETEQGRGIRLKNGTRRWNSEYKRYGEAIVERIPEGLRKGVLGEPEAEVDPGVRTMLDRLAATNPAEPKVNPYLLLRKKLGR